MEVWHKRQGGTQQEPSPHNKQKWLTCLEEPKAVLDCYWGATRMENISTSISSDLTLWLSNSHAFKTNTLPSSVLLTLLLILVKIRCLRSVTHDDRIPSRFLWRGTMIPPVTLLLHVPKGSLVWVSLPHPRSLHRAGGDSTFSFCPSTVTSLLTEPDLKRGSDATIPRANKGPASQPPRASWGLLIHEKALSLVSWLLQFVKTPLRACSCRVKDCGWKYISSKHHARNVASHLTVKAYELRNNKHTEV